MAYGSAGIGQLPSVRSRIYRVLYDSRSFCSKQALAAACSVSMPTLYQNLNELMEEGLVRYSGEERSTGGRRAQGLEIVPDARLALGVSVTGRHLRLSAADLNLNELAYRKVDFDLASHLAGEDQAMAGLIESFLDDYQIDRAKLLGVGVTIPGLVSPDESQIVLAPTLELRDAPLAGLTRGIAYPLHVENDGTASGHAESYVRRQQENLAYLSLEDGVGGAVLIGGIPYPGSSSKSGEFGHICVEPGGLLCSCGRRGCLEAYCSASRIEAAFGTGLEDFFRGVEEHRPEYETLLYDMLRHLAVGINNIHMVLDCDVVLGGFLSEYLQPYLPALRQYVTAGNPFMQDADFVQMSSVPRHITTLGAALYFVRSFVTSV